MDELHVEVSRLVEQAARKNEDASATFYKICDLAYQARGDQFHIKLPKALSPLRARPPRLTEAWFC